MSVEDLAAWRSVGDDGGFGVVTMTGALCWDTLPEPSKASTVYWYVVDGVTGVSA